MTRTPFDQFSKQFLEELLTLVGEVKPTLEVPGEPRFVDIWFAPFPQPTVNRQTLGLLGLIATTCCLLEPFRNQPSFTEVRNCLLKLFLLQADFQRQAKRERQTIPEAELPQLWILAPSASDNLVNTFRALVNDTWGEGIYLFADGLKTAMIAINELPRTPETLWLRVLGRDATQQQAIEEVIALPVENPQRSAVLKLLSTWKINIEISGEIDEDERRLLMTLSQAYLEWEQQTERRGLEQGQRLVVENLLKVRFGELDEQLAGIIPSLLQLPTEQYTRLLLQLSQLSREELLAQFQPPQA
ncbi:flagellar assembly protein H [Scytonema sp. NUACC26]|uniref:flagellar assembly protein H n=1 Tax=Scytonema sp. NUACC26 TaxID=3140176 RepID=UPI0034DC65F4